MAEDYPDLLVWVDVETTGLNPGAAILELGLLLTDAALNKIDSRSWVIYQNAYTLGGMEDWCLRQHGRSGLIADSAASKNSLELVREQALSYLKSRAHRDGKLLEGKVPMCGASVHFDRAWLKRWMPGLEAWFYYGNLDVSSLEKLARLWYPELDPWEDRGMHRVDPDNEDAVAELQFYRDHILRAPGDMIQIT